MTMEAKGNKPIEFVHAGIVFLLMFVFRFIPAPEPITAYGMNVLGVFLGVIYGWSFCGLMWPSLLALVAMGVSSFGNEMAVWASAFGNSTAVLTLVSMLLFGAMQATKTTDWLVNTLTNLKFAQGKPWAITFLLLFVPFLLGTVISGVVVILFMITILDGIFKKMGLKPGDKYAVMMIIGVNIFAGIGMVVFPFLGWDLMTIGTVSAATGVTMNYAMFMVVVWPALILFCIIYVLFMKYILKCDASKLSEIQVTNESDLQLKKNQKYILYLTLAYLIGCTFVGLFTGTEGIRYVCSALGVYGVTLLILTLMIIIKTEDGPLLNAQECTKFVSWDMYFLIVAALFIANQLTNQDTGISTWAVQTMTPLFNSVGEIGFLVLLAIITVILTNIGNNMAMGFTLLSIVSIMYNAGMQFNPMVAATLITILCLFGFLFPASSIGGAIIHASEWTTPKTVYKYVTISLVLGTVVVMAIVIPFGNMLL